MREWQKSHPGYSTKYVTARRARLGREYPERDRAYTQSWRAAHPTYQHEKKAERRAQIIAFLGGSCIQCGTTEQLHFDHIDPATKAYNIQSYLTRSWEKLLPEILKCQLLCQAHHLQKTMRHRWHRT